MGYYQTGRYSRDTPFTDKNAESLLRSLAGGDLPSKEVIHKKTMDAIEADFGKNYRKYSDTDRMRIARILEADKRLIVRY